MASISVQDYLLTIYRLQEANSPVGTTLLAARLGIAPASVTGMVRKLHRQGMLEHVPYRGVALTEAGEREALRLLRRHRLWELFLTEVLGLAWDEVHDEAHRLEHATSERVADKLAEFLRQPQTDPHGQQIPTRDGALPFRTSLPLAEVGRGRLVQIVEVPDDNPDLLRRLAEWGLVPGTWVMVMSEDSAQDGVRIRVGDQERVLLQKTLEAIRVILP
jgi:DtxR family Mn-dependent transcriptional regulator